MERMVSTYIIVGHLYLELACQTLEDMTKELPEKGHFPGYKGGHRGKGNSNWSWVRGKWFLATGVTIPHKKKGPSFG